MPPVIGDVLWTPPADVRETTEIGRYLNWLRDERGRDFADYDALWRWSVEDLTLWLRRARLVGLSLESNGGLCRSLLRVRHGVPDPTEEVAA